jgi:hypothetical protein
LGLVFAFTLCCGGLFATTSTARSKRAHASGCNSVSFDGSRLAMKKSYRAERSRFLQQLRADQGERVRCSRLCQNQRVLPLSAGALLPLSQNGPGDPETTMKPAVEPDAIEEATIDLYASMLGLRANPPAKVAP